MPTICIMTQRQQDKLATISAKLQALCYEVNDPRVLEHLQDAQRDLSFASRRVQGLDR